VRSEELERAVSVEAEQAAPAEAIVVDDVVCLRMTVGAASP